MNILPQIWWTDASASWAYRDRDDCRYSNYTTTARCPLAIHVLNIEAKGQQQKFKSRLCGIFIV